MSQTRVMFEDKQLEEETTREAKGATQPLLRAFLIGAVTVLGSLVVAMATSLWREWHMLKEDIGYAELHTVVGYPNVSPALCFAQRPKNWFHSEGGQALLWSRWVDGVGHHWYRFAPGDIDAAHVVMPQMNRRARAIDLPLVEINDGKFWRKIPARVQVVGHSVMGLNCVYPIPILLQVQVINDVIAEHPYAVTLNLMASPRDACSIFDAEHDGHRLTLAPTGYFLDRKPLFYDRGTESLWREDGETLKSIAGKYKGEGLARVARLAPIAWGTWLDQNPHSRLVVGADRSHAIPQE